MTGDFDVDEAKALIEKYFGEIPRGPDVNPRDKRAGTLDESVSLYHEDNFAAVPQLTMVWPTVDQFHPDSYALEILSEYLSEGKRAPLNEVLIDERKLTSGVSTFNYGKVLSGEVDAGAAKDLVFERMALEDPRVLEELERNVPLVRRGA